MACAETQSEENLLAVLYFSWLRVFKSSNSVGSAQPVIYVLVLSQYFSGVALIHRFFYQTVPVTGFPKTHVKLKHTRVYFLTEVRPCKKRGNGPGFLCINVVTSQIHSQGLGRYLREGCYPTEAPAGSPGFSSVGNTTISIQFALLTKCSLPLHGACYVLEKTTTKGWICPLLMRCFLRVPNPPIWNFWNIRIFPLLCLVYALHVIIFPLPPQ